MDNNNVGDNDDDLHEVAMAMDMREKTLDAFEAVRQRCNGIRNAKFEPAMAEMFGSRRDPGLDKECLEYFYDYRAGEEEGPRALEVGGSIAGIKIEPEQLEALYQECKGIKNNNSYLRAIRDMFNTEEAGSLSEIERLFDELCADKIRDETQRRLALMGLERKEQWLQRLQQQREADAKQLQQEREAAAKQLRREQRRERKGHEAAKPRRAAPSGVLEYEDLSRREPIRVHGFDGPPTIPGMHSACKRAPMEKLYVEIKSLASIKCTVRSAASSLRDVLDAIGHNKHGQYGYGGWAVRCLTAALLSTDDARRRVAAWIGSKDALELGLRAARNPETGPYCMQETEETEEADAYQMKPPDLLVNWIIAASDNVVRTAVESLIAKRS